VEGAERDSTQDWLLPESKAPPRLGELELRVDEALAIARSCEQAVNVVGDAALEAARQARRAAELAESASAVALDASRAVQATPAGPAAMAAPAAVPAHAGTAEDDLMRRFNERADRVMTRLRALERIF
jgi:hypothetical protein